MSTDDIMKLMEMAAALRMLVRISPLGSITMRPVPDGTASPQRRPLNAAEKMRAYRARRKAAAAAAAAGAVGGETDVTTVTDVTGKVTPDGENVTGVTDVTTAVTPSPSPGPPTPPAHTHVKGPDPCTVDEAWNFAQNSGLSLTREGVELWHASNRETGWTRTRQGTDIIEPVTDWRSRLIRSQAWIRAEIAKAEGAEAWARNAKAKNESHENRNHRGAGKPAVTVVPRVTRNVEPVPAGAPSLNTTAVGGGAAGGLGDAGGPHIDENGTECW